MMARINDAFDNYVPPTSYSTVDEQEKRAGAQQPGYGGNVGSSVTNQVPNTVYPTAGLQTTPKAPETAAERLARQTQERKFGTPDNPQPYEAPEGTHWNNYNGTWYLYNAANVRIGDASGYDKTKIGVSSTGKGNTVITPNEPGAPGSSKTQIYTASDGKQFTDQAAYATYETNLRNSGLATAAKEAENKAARQSAYDLLLSQFKQYGLESLVEGIKNLIQQNVSPSEFAIRLQNTDAYKQRFAANQDRIKQGLRALTPAEYIGLEDQYQNIMRNYGLPSSYYSKDAMGTQAGFNKFISNDVSAAELEDRIATAQKRVINADPNVTDALRQFYPDITNADILAYTLDPTNALENIKRKVTAAEIGGAALGQGLGTNVNRAEELAKYGITKAQAQQGYGTIGEFLPTAEKLGDIYSKQGLGAYDQTTAEREVFGTAGAAEAAQKRKKLTQLEQAQFGGQAGTAQGALDRGRQGSF